MGCILIDLIEMMRCDEMRWMFDGFHVHGCVLGCSGSALGTYLPSCVRLDWS